MANLRVSLMSGQLSIIIGRIVHCPVRITRGHYYEDVIYLFPYQGIKKEERKLWYSALGLHRDSVSV